MKRSWCCMRTTSPIYEMEKLFSELAAKAKSHDARGIKEVLKELIPEYMPDLGRNRLSYRDLLMLMN
ncbi:MAG: hypothetical protein V2B20_22125 [Pseudomonadota bacterium]